MSGFAPEHKCGATSLLDAWEKSFFRAYCTGVAAQSSSDVGLGSSNNIHLPPAALLYPQHDSVTGGYFGSTFP